MSAMIRPLALICSFVVGWFVPQGATLAWIIPWIVGFMLFMVFLGLNAHKLALRRSHYLILALNLLIPVFAYIVVGQCTKPGSQIALAAFFTGLAPTATAAPAIAGFLKREAEYVVSGLLLTTFAVSIALPALLPWALQQHEGIAEFFDAFLHVAKSVALTILLPIALARIVRVIYPNSKTWTKRGKNLTFAAWIFMVTIIACRTSKFINAPENNVSATILLEVGAISLAICAFNFIVGYFIGEKDKREEASQTLGQKNTAAMIVFATMYAEPIVALGPTMYVLWHNLWNAIQLAYVGEKELIASKAHKDDVHDAQKNVGA